MRISWIEVSGVKTFVTPQHLPIRNLNLIYGSNSSGKSTLMQSILLLKQSLISSLTPDGEVLDFRGPVADLGGFRTFVSNHDMSTKMEIALGLVEDERRLFGSDGSGLELRLVFVAKSSQSDRPWLHRVQIRRNLDRREIVLTLNEDGDAELEGRSFSALLDLFIASSPSLSAADTPLDEKDVRWLRDWCREHPMRSMVGWFPFWSPRDIGFGRVGRPYGGSRDSPRAELLREFAFTWMNEVHFLVFELRELFNEIVYIGPLREFPRRVSGDTFQGAGIGTRGERLVLHLARRPDLVEKVNSAFQLLEIDYDISVENVASNDVRSAVGEIAVAILRDKKTGIVLSPADVGFGISQVLPIVVQMLGNTGSTILVEQPEIHLHPKLQSRLADVMIESVKELGNCLIVETHSDQLLYRIQRRFREGALGPISPQAFLGVSYVGPSLSGGGEVQALRLAEDGSLLDAWPGGFFDDSFDDLMVGP